MKIYKFVPDDFGRIHLPGLHYILDVQRQNGVITVWAIVDPTQPSESVRIVYTKLTGNEVEPEERHYYYKTLQHDDGSYVEHIFVR